MSAQPLPAAFPVRAHARRDAAATWAGWEARHALIRTTGRRTGRQHTARVCFAWSDGSLYVLARRRPEGGAAHWCLNARSSAAATVEISGVAFRAVVTDPLDEEVARPLVLGLLQDKYGRSAVEAWHRGGSPTPLRLDPLGLDLPGERPDLAATLAYAVPVGQG